MDVKNKKAPFKMRRHDGFTTVEIVIMLGILTIVTMFGLMGITSARASVRLSGAAREYATYIEKARMHSIRNHADDDTDRASVAINEAKTSYNVTMDLDGNGTLETKTIALPNDVSFETVETIAFDWRGRTMSIVEGVTTSNAQVSITLKNGSSSVSVDVTGSGDITVASQVFDDSVPNVNLRVGDLAAAATPTPSQVGVATPTPTPPLTDGSLPTPTPTPQSDATPTPTPDNSGSGSSGSGSSGSGSSGSGSGSSGSGSQPTPTPSPTPRPAATATPTPTPVTPCTITTDPTSELMIGILGTKTIKVSHNSSSPVTITATSSKPSDLQVTPGSVMSVAAGSSASFTVKSKSILGVYNVTFNAGCGSKTVSVTVLL